MKKMIREHKACIWKVLVVFGVAWVIISIYKETESDWLYNIHRDLLTQTCANGERVHKKLYTSSIDGKTLLFSRCILSVPGPKSVSHFVPVLEPHLTEPFLSLPREETYTDRVLILTSLRNAAKFLPTFAKQLSILDYPHSLIRVCFAEEGSSDDSFRVAKEIVTDLKKTYGFVDASLFKLPIAGNNYTLTERKDIRIELKRRGHMARARNMLANMSLTNETWVLWIDVDVEIFRPDLIQQFIHSNKDVMVATALAEYVHPRYEHKATAYRNYDLNSFNETIVNGRAVRLYTHDFKAQGRDVPIQFVGACALMIKANCIRKGLHFPEEVIRSPDSEVQAIESEGLGLLARQMGFGVFVLPFVEVFHVPVY